MSEDGFISGDTGGSFWEVDQYKRTVKRQEDGHKLCGDLIMLIEERAKVEKHYAKSLKAWNKKWMDLVEKGRFRRKKTIMTPGFSISNRTAGDLLITAGDLILQCQDLTLVW